jgi:hypothetical protein
MMLVSQRVRAYASALPNPRGRKQALIYRLLLKGPLTVKMRINVYLRQTLFGIFIYCGMRGLLLFQRKD